MQNGFIKNFRAVLDNAVCCKDTDYFAVWNYLLLNATYKNKFAILAGQKILLKPGEIITGRSSISKFWNISHSKVERILTTLEKDGQISQKTSSSGRLITITNWSIYQIKDKSPEQQNNIINKTVPSTYDIKNKKSDSDRTASGQRKTVDIGQRVDSGSNCDINTYDLDTQQIGQRMDNPILAKSDTNKNKESNINITNNIKGQNLEYIKIVNNFIEKKLTDETFKNSLYLKNTDVQAWVLEIDRLVRLDKHTQDTIIEVLEFSLYNPFWSNQIVSLLNIRKKSKRNGLSKFENCRLSLETEKNYKLKNRR